MKKRVAKRTLTDRLREESKKRRDFPQKFDRAMLEVRAAELLHEARQRAGVSQEELARRLNTRQGAISRIEAGQNLTLRNLSRIAEALGYTVDLRLMASLPAVKL